MAPITKSLLHILSCEPSSFPDLYQKLHETAIATNSSGFDQLKLVFCKHENEWSTKELVKLVRSKLLLQPYTPSASAALKQYCTNLVTLQSMPSSPGNLRWSLSGGTLFKSVLDFGRCSTDQSQWPLIPRERILVLLQCCRKLEWTSRDCFVVMKHAKMVGFDVLSKTLQDELERVFKWPQWLLVMMQAIPIAPVEKLTVARNWVVSQGDGYMALYLRHLIALAKDCEVEVHCDCRTLMAIDGPRWIACDGCGSWYHQSCVGINNKTDEEVMAMLWTCPLGCEHVPKDDGPHQSTWLLITSSLQVSSQSPSAAAAHHKAEESSSSSVAAAAGQASPNDKRKRFESYAVESCDEEDDSEDEDGDDDDDEDGDGSNVDSESEMDQDDEEATTEEKERIMDFVQILRELELKWISPQRAQQELEIEALPEAQRKAAFARMKRMETELNDQRNDPDWKEDESSVDDERESGCSDDDYQDGCSDEDDEASSDDSEPSDDQTAASAAGFHKRKKPATGAKKNAFKRPRVIGDRTIPLDDEMPADNSNTSVAVHSHARHDMCVPKQCQSAHEDAFQRTIPLHASIIDQFVKAQCSVKAGLNTSATDLYTHYEIWHRHSSSQKGKPMRKKEFWRAIAVRFCKSKTGGIVMFRGLSRR